MFSDFLSSSTIFTEYVKREKIDCYPIIREYDSLLEAMGECSSDRDCGAVSQPCLGKGKQVFSTCLYPPATKLSYQDSWWHQEKKYIYEIALKSI